ncbi:bifunctional 5,10-methylenetetrahydrofolate dehydrogenase/5,10-methenyltetrahydrofolate cyclohydrolase [Candidatus Absconditicoccus praedator]|uniref:bifunctional 5,10-methylenetetrahydrofolate dehydrogenase/5,10-methenyltetrahydrofolate cyclohydrolase n=1 Tax=Candidatus Absconditicoccus praedator TaxID=2735562 RepID=UPI001E4F3692|nr:bifunctional 5,10-methylenetetrahydrofolate dehydrogenase/5,10-methenyltetrahydrofolate cyclohydrolase [Candidatus Absconditicoccus praedator]UFX83002.1 bifunctional 5,10-methylenetetrahydrofolate dehydrogenase/5,10-methenyltetrahydrofolate cyclohydrolase [Candidatus Absconditicoccus praedator]
MILYGDPVKEKIRSKIKNNLKNFDVTHKYVGILLLNDDPSSYAYVNKKKEFGNELGIDVVIHDRMSSQINPDSSENIIHNIKAMNEDPFCVGIVVQLPLPKNLKSHQSEILSSIDPQKDIDGLGGVNFGLSSIGFNNFIPATPKAVINILNYYNLDEFRGKKVTILGQSNLVGKPLAMDMIKKGAEVFSFNEYADIEDMKMFSKNSDYIISATGKSNLIDENFVAKDGSQVLIDVGWTKEDGKVKGDIDFDFLKDQVRAITPVPGGVGPVTVASLFENIFYLQG